MPRKTITRKFVDMKDAPGTMKTYRVTFFCSNMDYPQIVEEIQGYGEVLKEEVEIEE